MAITFGGDETPPGIFNGTDETKKVHRWCSSQRRANASRSNSSPKVGSEWRYFVFWFQLLCALTNGHSPSGQDIFVQEYVRVLRRVHLVVATVSHLMHCKDFSVVALFLDRIGMVPYLPADRVSGYG